MTPVVERLTDDQVASLDRNGFLIVEGGLVSDRAFDALRKRDERLFDGEYETEIKPDEVNWVPGRDLEDRTRQICNTAHVAACCRIDGSTRQEETATS